MPYSFSGPQRNGEEYSTFCALQTLIDLAYIELATGEELLLKNATEDTSPFLLLQNLKWVKIVIFFFPPPLEDQL